jgi:hypothetical protein
MNPSNVWRQMRRGGKLLVGCLCVVVAACSGGDKGAYSDGTPHIQQIVSLYTKYVSEHKGQPPRNADELKKWAATLKKEELDQMKIKDLDAAFISPRDNQPYGVIPKSMKELMGGGMKPPLPGQKPPTNARTMSPVIVYEKVGKDGKHWVAYLFGGSVEEVDEQRFRELVPNP